MEEFQLSAPNLTAAGLLCLVVLLVLTGRLVPWWIVDAWKKDAREREDTLTRDRDYWRGTAQKLQDAALLQAQAQIEQLEMGRTQTHLLSELQAGRKAAEPDAIEMAQADDER